MIGELVAENAIVMQGPDLYTYFEANNPGLYDDAIHPSGAGYQAMAPEWFARSIEY